VHALLVVAITAQYLFAQSEPFATGICAGCIMIPLVVFYVARVAVCFHAMANGVAPLRRRSRLWWLVTPVCLVVMLSASTTRWPFRLRLAWSQPALEAEVRRLLDLPPPTTSSDAMRPGWARFDTTQQLGWYSVSHIEVDYSHKHVYFSIGWGIRPHGLVYVGDSTEPPEEEIRRQYLPPGWALFLCP